MKFGPKFFNRDDSGKIPQPGMSYVVDDMVWSVDGGCISARMTATNPDPLGLWELAEYLRCPVIIEDEIGRRAWWGLVYAVTIQIGKMQFGISLESMANSIAVAYSYVEAGSATTGTRKTTAWTTDAASVLEYGQKDLLVSQDGLTDAAATARQAAVLDAKKYPGGQISLTGGGETSASIECRGWIDTLDWRYAPVATTASVDTTTQINTLVGSYGQFFAGLVLQAASGISTSEYRDGDKTTLKEIEGLRAIGGANGRRLLADVTQERYLYIYEEPAKVETCSIDSAGRLYGPGKIEWDQAYPPVGQWARMQDIIPASVDTSKMADPSLQFLEGFTWSPSTGYVPQYRGQLSIEDMFRVEAA